MQAARQWNLVELQSHWRSRCNLAHPSTNVPSMLQYLHLRECSQQHSKQVPRYNFLARRLFECGDRRYKRHYSLGKPSCCSTHPPPFAIMLCTPHCHAQPLNAQKSLSCNHVCPAPPHSSLLTPRTDCMPATYTRTLNDWHITSTCSPGNPRVTGML